MIIDFKRMSMTYLNIKSVIVITILLLPTIVLALDLPQPDWQNSAQNSKKISDEEMNPVQEFQTQKVMMLKQIQQQETCINQAKNQDDLNFCQPKKEKCEKKQGKNSWKRNQQ